MLEVRLDDRKRRGGEALQFKILRRLRSLFEFPGNLFMILDHLGNISFVELLTREFAELVDKLPAGAKRCWNQASSRTFDIGIQAGLTPDRFEDVRLGPESLRHLSRLRASILVTVYAPSAQ